MNRSCSPNTTISTTDGRPQSQGPAVFLYAEVDRELARTRTQLISVYSTARAGGQSSVITDGFASVKAISTSRSGSSDWPDSNR